MAKNGKSKKICKSFVYDISARPKLAKMRKCVTPSSVIESRHSVFGFWWAGNLFRIFEIGMDGDLVMVQVVEI